MMANPDNSQNTDGIFDQPKKCAIYARYSCDLSRPSSIEDQTRKCRQECQRHNGWAIAEEWVVADREVSGRSLVGRDALASLKEAAKRKVRPFDCIIIDDTSRLGRNVPDVLKLAQVFEHYGVALQFVSPPLNSCDPSFHILLTFKAMMDEQYSIGLADKVWRGLEGRVLKGYNAGAACYGYRNVAVPDPTGKGDGLLGVRLESVPEKAKVVVWIFEMYAGGFSLDGIAKVLRAEGILAPKPPRKNSVRGWSADGIAEILRNKRYIGIYEWGRTTNSRDPETGRIVTKPRPEDKWVRFDNPAWKIVSEELWEKVQKQLELKRHCGIPKNGGLNRTKRSQGYLFSGLLCCGICGGPMNIVDGTAGGAAVWYGCGAHRYKDACTNNIRIGRDRLEEQLLPWLTRDLLLGDRLKKDADCLFAEIQKRVDELQVEARKNAINVPELVKQLAEELLEARNIREFIAKAGSRAPMTLLGDLEGRDARVKKIEDLLARTKQPEPGIRLSADEIREHLLSKLGNLQAVLTSQPLLGRTILREHIRRITLTPGEMGGRRIFHVGVEFALGGLGGSGVMLTDGVDASMQQYGFSTITVSGLTLDTSRVRRKPEAPKQESENGGSAPILLTPAAEANDPTQGSDSGRKEIHA
jgi:DNA invertase Pin-like site-specific DNA recombinase